ncbi:MAG: hypothetical protein HY909_15895 [Deltaproteobacteria bacterium]|nr:hypothetical protein [Deltaproteobacteria bacterium]
MDSTFQGKGESGAPRVGRLGDSGGGRGGGRVRSLTAVSRALRLALAVGAIAEATGSAGCKDTDATALHRTLTNLGVEDVPARPPRVFRIVCDRSETAPCEHGLVMQLISEVAHEAYQRPGSRIEVHLMGEVVAETRLVGSATIPPREDRGERAARAAEERFVQSIRPVLCTPLGAALASPRPRRSPIAESLDKVALGPTQGLPVEVIAVTDLRDTSLGDMECGRLPSAVEFQARLRRRGLLELGTYANTRVHFVVGDRGPIPRRDCPVTMGRERALMQLWTTALRTAGAREITFHTELPDLTPLLSETPDAGAPSATTTSNRSRTR